MFDRIGKGVAGCLVRDPSDIGMGEFKAEAEFGVGGAQDCSRGRGDFRPDAVAFEHQGAQCH